MRKYKNKKTIYSQRIYHHYYYVIFKFQKTFKFKTSFVVNNLLNFFIIIFISYY